VIATCASVVRQSSSTFAARAAWRHEIDIDDRRLARIVRQCQDLPGQHLFEYVGDDGPNSVRSGPKDVNNYIREEAGEEFNGQGLSHLGGTLNAAMILRDRGCCDGERDTKKASDRGGARVARVLGNTRPFAANVTSTRELLKPMAVAMSFEPPEPENAITSPGPSEPC